PIVATMPATPATINKFIFILLSLIYLFHYVMAFLNKSGRIELCSGGVISRRRSQLIAGY
ncbi:MAG: hypothetical protein RPU40_05940, partial [Candidatus Sedimenticola sp. (ex Thyasira tokunagai)]